MAKCIASSTLNSNPDTYFYTLAQTGPTLATIASDDCLHLFNTSLTSTQRTPSAHNGITCLTSCPHTQRFATAGRDALIKTWDLRAPLVASAQISEPKGRGFSALAGRDHFLAAGTESTKEGLGDVSVLLYDLRNPSQPVRRYDEAHSDTLITLAFHPEQANVLLSGSTDGLVSVLNLEIAEEDDALLRVLNPRSAVHCAGFLSATEVYVATMDEQLSFYSISISDGPDSGERDLQLGDVREQLRCSYIIDVLPGASQGSVAVACGHNINETLSLVEFDFRDGTWGRRVELMGAHGDDVVRDLRLVEGVRGRAVSCGEDGRVRVWDLGGAGG